MEQDISRKCLEYLIARTAYKKKKVTYMFIFVQNASVNYNLAFMNNPFTTKK